MPNVSWAALALVVALALPGAADQHDANNTTENTTVPPDDTVGNDTVEHDRGDRTSVPWAALGIGLAIFFGAVVFSRRD